MPGVGTLTPSLSPWTWNLWKREGEKSTLPEHAAEVRKASTGRADTSYEPIHSESDPIFLLRHALPQSNS